MSYCRWFDGDVYVIATTSWEHGDVIECVACGDPEPGSTFGPSFVARTEQQMIDHLLEHRATGDKVPQYALDRLEQEKKERN